MSNVPWWVNALAGVVCLAAGVNFLASAYGLRLGGKPLDTTTLPKYELRPQNGVSPSIPLSPQQSQVEK